MNALIFIINLIFEIFYILILIRAILSFIPHNRFHPLINPVYFLTEPVLRIFRLALPPTIFGKAGMDVSLVITIIILWLLHQIILKLLSLI